MKSFSIKTLALALVVVASQAIAYPGASYINKGTNAVKGLVKATDKTLFGELKVHMDNNLYSDTFEKETHRELKGGLPVLRSYLRFNNGYFRAGFVIAAGAAVQLLHTKPINTSPNLLLTQLKVKTLKPTKQLKTLLNKLLTYR